MRIAFDGTTLTPGRTGVGYYTEHLLQHLAREIEATGDELVVVSNRPIHTEHPLPSHVRVHDRHRAPLRAVWLQAMAPLALADIRPDVAHFTNGMMPALIRTPTVVTVHDLSVRLYPQFHPPRRLLINRPLQALAVRRADRIVTVSHSTRRDLLRFHRVDADRVSVVHEAASAIFRPERNAAHLAAVRSALALPERFALYVGTVEPRKNLPRLVEAFARARAGGLAHHLVFVGPYGWLSGDLAGTIARAGVAPYVHVTGYVPYEWLPALYTLGEFFVFPSIYEGFGLPVVEAMACGAPVLTSNSSSLAEIAGDAAVTVDPLDVEALATALRTLGLDAGLRARLADAGLRRARDFSWAEAARSMLGVYRRAVADAGVTRSAAAPRAEAAEATSMAAGATDGPDGH